MKSPLVTRVTVILAAAVVLFGSSLFFWSCTKEGPAGPAGPPGNPGGNGNLQDPTIIPEVISTSPADHSTGPYKLFSPGDDQYNPNFVLQFNKLINTNELTVPSVKVQGFDRPVYAILYQNYRIWILNKVTNGPFDNILAFNVYDSTLPYQRVIYKIGHTYTVTIDTSIVDINGNHMARPFSFSYTPEPYFRVTTFIPENNVTTVPTGPLRISVTFNSHVDTSIRQFLHVTPPLLGTWKISDYDSSTAYYSYQGPLPYDSGFVVSVDVSAQDVYGNATTVPYSSSFRTAAFGIGDAYPEPGSTDVPPVSGVALYFNGIADTASIRSAFSIQPPTPGVLFPFSWYVGFTPASGLAPSTQYTVTLSTALKASDGTALKSPFTLTFTTVQFAVTDNYPEDGEFGVSRSQGISMYFNSMIDTGTAPTAFSISPPISGQVSAFPGGPGNGGQISFSHSVLFDANTVYTVTLGTGLTDARGNHLSAPFSFTFKTGNN